MTLVNQVFETFSDADFSFSLETSVEVGINKLRMHVRAAADDPTVWIEATTENGMLTVAPAAGDNWTVSLLIPESKLLYLPAGNYVHSCIMLSFSDSLRTEIWRGSMVHSIGPTRWNSSQ